MGQSPCDGRNDDPPPYPSPSVIDDEAFAAAMALLGPFERAPLLALAVSGGPDSMALAWLAHKWAAQREGAVVAFIVDHGLRAESADEAARAASSLHGFGVETHILKITSAPPKSGTQAWARTERYRLLEAAVRRRGALHLLLGHHRDDQAETVLLRLARGSGAKGLSGMRPVRWMRDMRLVRPVLGFAKAQLAATAAKAGLVVADDPSNQNPAYARTRMRMAVASAGGDAARLAATAEALASEDSALDAYVAALSAQALQISPIGLLGLERRQFVAAPRAVAHRLLARVVTIAAGAATLPRHERIAALHQAILNSDIARKTLGGAVIRLAETHILFWREPARLPQAIPAAGMLEESYWDGRFRLNLMGVQPTGLTVGPLGYKGLRAWENMAGAGEPAPILRQAPRQALIGLPALWRGGALAGLTTFALSGPNYRRIGELPGIMLFDAKYEPRRPLVESASC